jgi:hypothetical protein
MGEMTTQRSIRSQYDRRARSMPAIHLSSAAVERIAHSRAEAATALATRPDLVVDAAGTGQRSDQHQLGPGPYAPDTDRKR